VPVRKAGKLPAKTYTQDYELEYGTATIEVHTDAFDPGDRVLIVDDVLATGGTARATAALVRQAGAEVADVVVLLELAFRPGSGLHASSRSVTRSTSAVQPGLGSK
jgi:adenine phosphoribosyltransferase